MCTLWNRSLLLFALLAASSMAWATPLERSLPRGAFSPVGSFSAIASSGASLSRPASREPRGGAMLLASLGLLALIAVRRLRALRAA